MYSEEYKQAVLRQKLDLKNALDEHYLVALGKVKCEITELSQFKMAYTRIAKILRDNDCASLAEATERHITEIEQELLAKQHYESSIVEAERDMMRCPSMSKYQDCCDSITKLEGWISFFKNAKDLPITISSPMVVKLSSAISQLEAKKVLLISEYSQAIEDLTSASNAVDLKTIDGKLERLSQLQLDNERAQTIVLLREDICNALGAIENLPHDIDLLTSFIKKITPSANRYCWAAIKICATTVLRGLEEEQGKWLAKYVVVAEKTYHGMSAQECTSWLDRTKNVPVFFSTEAVKKYHQVRSFVEKRLHESRVEGLIAMYDALTESEKHIFLSLLNNRK